MRWSYKTLTDAEYNVLSKVARRTGADCWFVLNQDCHGTDYVYDWEEERRMCLKTGVSMLAEGLDCQENYDNCFLAWNEKVTLRNLFAKLNIIVEIDWKIPVFHGLSRESFMALVKCNKIKYEKHNDDYCVDDVIYQFGQDDRCFGVVLINSDVPDNRLRKLPSSYNDCQIYDENMEV